MKPRPGSRLQHSATGRLASRAFAGGRGRSSPPRGPQMDAGEDAPAGLAGAAAPGQSSCGDPTRPVRLCPCQDRIQPLRCRRRRRALVWHLCWRRATRPAAGAGSWKGDAVGAALRLQDSQGQRCSRGGVGFSSPKLPTAAPASRAAARCFV